MKTKNEWLATAELTFLLYVILQFHATIFFQRI
jgi:hypothetical protein